MLVEELRTFLVEAFLAEWDESQHPRQPAGSEAGGEFASAQSPADQQRLRALAAEARRGAAAVARLVPGILGKDQPIAAKRWNDLPPDVQHAVELGYLKAYDNAHWAEQNWSAFGAEAKFNMAPLYVDASLLDGLARETVEEPAQYKLIKDGEDYERTGALGRALVLARAQEIATERGIVDAPLMTLEARAWEGWKNSSTGAAGLALQLAAAEELGAYHRLSPHQEAMAREWAATTTDIRGPKAMEAVKAYVRANWETTQFLAEKAGVDSFRLYRGISVPQEAVHVTPRQTIVGEHDYAAFPALQNILGKHESYTYLPDLALLRNGASSFTATDEVANGWLGINSDLAHPERVVLRAEVPATAVLSIPAYGKNVYGEQEVVVLGTPWKGWDAWLGAAPSFDSWDPAKHPRDPRTGRFLDGVGGGGGGQVAAEEKDPDVLRQGAWPGRSLVVDLNAGPHWLAKPIQAGEWQEERHPRVPAGSPDGGRFAPGDLVEVGITSATAGHRDPRAIADEMVGFVDRLRKGGIAGVHAQLGEGGFWSPETKSVETEPTWVLRYRGNGEALAMVAAEAAAPGGDPGKRQFAVVLAHRAAEDDPEAVPRIRWRFAAKLSPDDRARINDLAEQAGLPGWTWNVKHGMLASNPIPQWGQDAQTHAVAARRFTEALGQAGLPHSVSAVPVRVTVMQSEGEGRYEDFIRGDAHGRDAGVAGGTAGVGGRPGGGRDGGDGYPRSPGGKVAAGEWSEELHPRQPAGGPMGGEFAPKDSGGGNDGANEPGARAGGGGAEPGGGAGLSATAGSLAVDTRPVSLDRLKAGDPETIRDVYGRTGTVATGEDTLSELKIYPLQPLVANPQPTQQMLTDTGFKVEYFSFENDPESGVTFRPPDLKRKGYEQGYVWLYDPRVTHGSFDDVEYTRTWRTFHEVAHALSEQLVADRYGASRREGRLGVEMEGVRGDPAKRTVAVPLRALTLREAQRAIEWEDVAFRTQRILLDDYGVTISDRDFNREYNVNITDATYRVLTGDFGDPGRYGYRPSTDRANVKDLLTLLQHQEGEFAKAQARAPTKGIDLASWKPISDAALRERIAARRQRKLGERSTAGLIDDVWARLHDSFWWLYPRAKRKRWWKLVAGEAKHPHGGPAPPLLTAGEWAEDEHPRHPAGGPEGGQFAPKGSDSSSSSASDGGGSTVSPAQIAADRAQFFRLKEQWARTNNDLLNYIDRPGSAEATAKLDELKALVKQMHRLHADPGGLEGIGLPGGPRDIVVVGAGPGGLTAAVMGGTDGLDTLFVDAQTIPGGQAKFSSRIENYPGFPVGTSGRNLAESLYQQAERVGAEGKLGVRVTNLTYDPATGLKTLMFSDGEKVEARSVVLAGGLEFRKMDFPGANSQSVIYGDGERLAREGAGRAVVVVGGSNGAAQAALGVAQTASNVYVVSRSGIDKGMSDYQVAALRNHPKITIIEGDEIGQLWTNKAGHAESLTTKMGRRLPCNALGIFIGGAPDLKWLPPAVRLEKGKISVNSDLETGVPGVFAVGDIRHGSIGRIGAAVGDGQVAERGVFEYFKRLKGGSPVSHFAEGPRDVYHDEWDRFIDELFDLDKANPFLSGMVEEEAPPALTAGEWNDDAHPRWPKGHAKGGQFAPKGGAAGYEAESARLAAGVRGDVAPAPPSSSPVSTVLSTGRLAGTKSFGGGVNTTFLGEVGGVKAVIKPDNGLATRKLRKNIEPGNEAGREMAAHVVNDALGQLVDIPEAVYRDFGEELGPDTTYIDGQGPKPIGKALVMQFRDGQAVANTGWEDANPDELGRMGLFDAVIGNTDRHGGNALYDDGGHLVAIDHGLAFPASNEGNRGNFTAVTGRPPPLTADEIERLGKLASQAATVTPRLQQYLKPEEIGAMWDRVRTMQERGRIYEMDRG